MGNENTALDYSGNKEEREMDRFEHVLKVESTGLDSGRGRKKLSSKDKDS